MRWTEPARARTTPVFGNIITKLAAPTTRKAARTGHAPAYRNDSRHLAGGRCDDYLHPSLPVFFEERTPWLKLTADACSS